MNPPTDAGKKSLSLGFRNRFAEFFVDELVDSDDLAVVVNTYLREVYPQPPTENVVNFYAEVREYVE